MKILVDTDIGSDIDDALCLSYLLSRPDVELVGISTVSGASEERAKLVFAITTFYEREVPICVGAAEPRTGEQRQPDVPQRVVLSRWPHQAGSTGQPVEAFMREAIESAPGEVVLLAIGPLTNVARLILAYPDALPLLSRMVCMSGRFSNYQEMAQVPEWNVLCDVDAARICYDAASTVDSLFVSSDVTRRLVMERTVARERLTRVASQIGPVVDMSETWFADRPKMTIHDGLAAALLFEPDLCSYKRGSPVLDAHTAVTAWRDDDSSGVVATANVDVDRFFDHFFTTLAGEGMLPVEADDSDH